MWPDSLVREIAERRVVFFIGSGISKAAHPALPTWGPLLVKLGDRLNTKKDRNLIRKLVGQCALLDAAQIIRDGTNQADLAAELRTTFQVRPVPHQEVYRDLLLMDPKTIVTTNYDEFLEKNFEYYSGGSEAHSISKPDSTHLLNDLRSPIRSIVKMHGCITNPNNLVLDRASYFDARRTNPGLFAVVSALMTVQTVVFLGYSISDPDIQLILENINLYSRSDNPHYALMPKFDHKSIRDANRHTYNVSILEYSSEDHGTALALIRELRKRVEDIRSARGIV